MEYKVDSVEALERAKKVFANKGAYILPRFSPLDGIGKDLRTESSYEDAMKISGVGFEPIEHSLFTADGTVIKTHKAIFNKDTQAPLSVVNNRYTTIPNMEAFKLAEDLVNLEGYRYEVGQLKEDGKISRLILSGETTNIMGEAFTPYVILTNSFDCSHTLSLRFMYLRMVCLNGLVRESEQLTSSIYLHHTGDKMKRLGQIQVAAQKALQVQQYLQAEADVLATTSFTRADFEKEIIPQIIAKVYAKPEKLTSITPRQQDHVDKIIATALAAYDAPDTALFNGSAYKVLLAMADMDSHMATKTKASDVYINRVLQQGVVSQSLTNIIANYLIQSRGIKI